MIGFYIINGLIKFTIDLNFYYKTNTSIIFSVHLTEANIFDFDQPQPLSAKSHPHGL